ILWDSLAIVCGSPSSASRAHEIAVSARRVPALVGTVLRLPARALVARKSLPALYAGREPRLIVVWRSGTAGYDLLSIADRVVPRARRANRRALDSTAHGTSLRSEFRRARWRLPPEMSGIPLVRPSSHFRTSDRRKISLRSDNRTTGGP